MKNTGSECKLSVKRKNVDDWFPGNDKIAKNPNAYDTGMVIQMGEVQAKFISFWTTRRYQ